MSPNLSPQFQVTGLASPGELGQTFIWLIVARSGDTGHGVTPNIGMGESPIGGRHGSTRRVPAGRCGLRQAGENSLILQRHRCRLVDAIPISACPTPRCSCWSLRLPDERTCWRPAASAALGMVCLFFRRPGTESQDMLAYAAIKTLSLRFRRGFTPPASPPIAHCRKLSRAKPQKTTAPYFKSGGRLSTACCWS